MTSMQSSTIDSHYTLRTYIVTVRFANGTATYKAMGHRSASVHMAAFDFFDACGVTVRPAC